MTAKNRIAKYLWTFIKYFSLILAGFIAVLPVASCVITAFKTPEEYASTNVMTLPGKFYFKNFSDGMLRRFNYILEAVDAGILLFGR